MPTKKYLNISLSKDFVKLLNEIKKKRPDYKSNAEIVRDSIRRFYEKVIK